MRSNCRRLGPLQLTRAARALERLPSSFRLSSSASSSSSPWPSLFHDTANHKGTKVRLASISSAVTSSSSSSVSSASSQGHRRRRQRCWQTEPLESVKKRRRSADYDEKGEGEGEEGGQVFYASDTNGPAATRVSGALPLRPLPNFHLCEQLFFGFRSKNSGGGGGGGGNRGADADVEYGAPFCQLCRAETEPGFTTAMHMGGNKAHHTHHGCREVALSTMTLLSIRGYPIEDMYVVWSDVLFHRADLFPRLPSLCRHLAPIEERASDLLGLLRVLQQEGVIDLTLAVLAEADIAAQGAGAASSSNMSRVAAQIRRRVAFERLEYIGDNAWGTNVSSRIMLLYPGEQWLYSQRCFSFSTVRDACEMNLNLEFVFDTLRLGELLDASQRWGLSDGKRKADFVEGLLGELHTAHWGFRPRLYEDPGGADADYAELHTDREAQCAALVQHCLTELYDLIVLYHTRECAGAGAVALAKRLGAQFLWLPTLPALRETKGRTGGFPTTVETLQFANALVPVHGSAGEAAADARVSRPRRPHNFFSLPGTPRLFQSRTSLTHEPPYHVHCERDGVLPKSTICDHTGADVFVHFRESLGRLGLLSGSAAPIRGGEASAAAARRGTGGGIDRATMVREGQRVPARVLWQACVNSAGARAPVAAAARCGLHREPMATNTAAERFPGTSVLLAEVEKVEGVAATARERRLAVALTNARPALRAKPTEESEEDDAAGAASPFKHSIYAAPGAKAPLGGVLTERNTCRGRFAFWGYPQTDAVLQSRLAEVLAAYHQRLSAREEPGTGAGGGDDEGHQGSDEEAEAESTRVRMEQVCRERAREILSGENAVFTPRIFRR